MILRLAILSSLAASPALAAPTPASIADASQAIFDALTPTQRDGTAARIHASTLVTAGRCAEAFALFASWPPENNGAWSAEDNAVRRGDLACAAQMAALRIKRTTPAELAQAPWYEARKRVEAGALLRRAGREAEGKAMIDEAYGTLREGAPVDPAIWEIKRQREFWGARAAEIASYFDTPLAAPTAETYARELAARPDWADDFALSGIYYVLVQLDRRDLAEPLLPAMGRSTAHWERDVATVAKNKRERTLCMRPAAPFSTTLVAVRAPDDTEVAAARALPLPWQQLSELGTLARRAETAATCSEEK